MTQISSGFSWNFFSQDKKEPIKQSLEVIKNKQWANLNDALQAIINQIDLLLQTDLKDQHKNEFRSIANNIKEIMRLHAAPATNSGFSLQQGIRQLEYFDQKMPTLSSFLIKAFTYRR